MIKSTSYKNYIQFSRKSEVNFNKNVNFYKILKKIYIYRIMQNLRERGSISLWTKIKKSFWIYFEIQIVYQHIFMSSLLYL